MAGFYSQLFREDFTSTDTVVVAHGLGRYNIVVRLVVGGEERSDLIESVMLDPADPRNSLTVNLTSVQTGFVQIMSSDVSAAGLATPEVASTRAFNNFAATVAPTSNDDSDDGYDVGSTWVDTSSGVVYVCTDASVGAAVWSSGGSGDVSGPGSSTDNALVRFDGTTGKIIQNSGVTLSDGNAMAGAASYNGVVIESHASRHLPGGADALTTAAPPGTAVQIGNTASVGVAASFARSDHVHTVTGGTPVNVTKSANAAGSASTFARSDHKHDVATAPAVSVGTVNAEGSATSLARSDHTHAVTGFSISGQAQGDVLYFNGTAWVRLPAGTAGQLLTTQGAASDPTWSSPKRYPNAASDPTTPAPADGDYYYNTSLKMDMRYDSSRSKWLSVESVTFQFGRNGNLTPAGTYLRAINGMVTSATLGYDALYNGTVVGLTIRRSTQSPASYAFVASGTDIATLAFPNLVFGVRTTTADGDFVQGDVLAARLVSDAVTPESDVQMFVRCRWRAT